ncbi:MAG: DUF4340 domain-containing protein [Verrucomicrobiae bacterium]|nr:DUF4340 domain-containing protein [Verrucomicrobiae bacterium]
MNRKQVLTLLALVVVLGAAGLLMYKRSQTTWQVAAQKPGQKLLGEFPLNEIAQITIRAGTNQLDLVKKDGIWRVRQRADYPANFGEIGTMLLKLAELKAVQIDEVTPGQLARYGLLPPGPETNTAVLVELADQAGRPVRSILLGKQHMRKPARPSAMDDFGGIGWPDGRYIMIGTNASVVALVSETFSQLEPKPEQWLNKEFFRVEKIKSASVEHREPTNSWTLSRETEAGEWQLAEARADEKLDKSKASSLNWALNSPYFNDVLSPETPRESLGLDNPTLIKIETFDGFHYTIKVGTKTNDALPIIVTVSANLKKERTPGPDEKPEDKERLDKEFKENLKKLEEKFAKEQRYAGWIYLVPSWSLDAFMRERGQLLETKDTSEPKPETAATATADTDGQEKAESDEIEPPFPLTDVVGGETQ